MSSELSEHKRRLAATYNLASALCQSPRRADRPASGHRVLDVATGTGATAITAAQRVGPAGHVVGVDIATDMLEQALRKIEAAQQTNIELHEPAFSQTSW